MSEIRNDRDVLDSLVRDACAMQDERGLIPEVETAQRYMAGVLERLDRKERDDAPKPASVQSDDSRASATKRAGAVEREYERRGGTPLEGKYRVTRKPATPTVEPVSNAKMRYLRRLLQRRIRLLMTKPDWASKIKAVNFVAANGAFGDERQRAALAEYERIVNDSNRLFGDWWKPPGRKAYSTDPRSSTPQ